MLRLASLFLYCIPLCGVLGTQQPPALSRTFAVATIKPSAPDAPAVTQIRGNRFFTEGTTFIDVFKYAYSVHPGQILGGPDWLRTEKFDILADPETEKRPTSDEMKALVRQLLTDRFHLSMHQEQKVLPVYALTRTLQVPKLKASEGNERGIPVAGYNPTGELSVGNATMAEFAAFLQRFALERPVVDQTDISGRYDLVLRWTPDKLSAGDPQPDAPAAPNLFTAIREQLGLKLQPAKAETTVFVIDHAEKPTEN